MNERLIAYTFSIADPTEGAAVGALACYFMMPFGATVREEEKPRWPSLPVQR
jgi:hypothetical protein